MFTHRINSILTSVFGDGTSFRAKELRRTTWKSQFYLSFSRSHFISCEKVARDYLDIANFTWGIGHRKSFPAKGLRWTTWTSQFYPSFWRSNLISCERRRVAPDNLQIAILPQFLVIAFHVGRRLRRTSCKLQFYRSFWRSNFISSVRVRKGCAGQLEIGILLQFWRSNLISCERVARDPWKSQFCRSFWRSNLISCERVPQDDLQIAIYLTVFGDRTSFRAKGLRFVPSRWHCPAPSREK